MQTREAELTLRAQADPSLTKRVVLTKCRLAIVNQLGGTSVGGVLIDDNALHVGKTCAGG